MSQLKVNTIRHTGASSDAVTLASDGTCTAKITNNLSNRNLIINGACIVNQYGTTSSTAGGVKVCDRWYSGFGVMGTTQSIHDLTSSDTGPWEKGFKKSFHIQNTTTGSSNATDQANIRYNYVEAQDVVNSGWVHTSTSSYMTLSFWVKVSLAGTYYVQLRTKDGTNKVRASAFTVSANTWKYVTITFPGASNITLNNDNGQGLDITFVAYWGTDGTDAGFTLDSWDSFNSSSRMPNLAQNWNSTANATFEVTGVQLEVGDVATDFEHRSHGDELARCQRYFFAIPYGSSGDSSTMIQNLESYAKSATEIQSQATFPVPMRTNPSFTGSATDCEFFAAANSADFAVNGFASYVAATGTNITGMNLRKSSASSMTAGQGGRILFRENGGYMHFSAEL